MPEQIIIDGKPVVVPPAVLAGGKALAEFWEQEFDEPVPKAIAEGGRAAVTEWYLRQPGAIELPPIPPQDIQAQGDVAVRDWYIAQGHLPPLPDKE